VRWDEALAGRRRPGGHPEGPDAEVLADAVVLDLVLVSRMTPLDLFPALDDAGVAFRDHPDHLCLDFRVDSGDPYTPISILHKLGSHDPRAWTMEST
jgi:hypothetical protein